MDEQKSSAFVLGELSAKVGSLESDMRLVRSDVAAIKTKLDEQTGGWRVLIALTTAAATVGAATTAIVEWMTRK
jgi:hypothetical protein